MTQQTVTLEEACLVITDGTHYTPKAQESGRPFLTVKDMLDGRLDFKTCSRISEADFQNAARNGCCPETGDILFSKDGTVGKVYPFTSEEDCAVLSSIAILRPRRELLDQGYFAHFLRSDSFLRKALRNKTGSAIRRIILANLRNLEIPLPPLEEQRRIAAVLDKAQSVSQLADLAGQISSDLIEAEMIRRFGIPGAPSPDLETLALADAGVDVIDCPHSTPKWTETGEVCLRTSNLGKGCWIWSDTRRISNQDFMERSRRALLEPGDIVLSREGTVGIAAIVQPEMRACMGQRLVQLKIDKDKLTPEYLLAQLLYLLKPERISHAMTGSTSKHINVKDLRQLQVLCPSIEDQLSFNAFCVSARSLRGNTQALFDKSTVLSKALQAEYFFT